MSVEIVNDDAIWDDFVEKSPYGLLFYKWRYLEAMAEFTNYTLERYGIYNGNKLIALFPIFSKNLFGFKALFSPPPQTGVPYLGFIMGPDYNLLKQDKKEKELFILEESFKAIVNKKRVNYVSVSLVPNFLDIRTFIWDSYKTNMSFTYSIDLRQTYDEIFNGFKNTIRRQIKKAMSYNLSLEKSKDLSVFYDLEKKRYEEQGLNFPIVNIKYLEKLFSLYPENLFLYYLYDEERNIKGSILTHEFNKQFLLLMGATKTEDNIGGNEFIIWELIKKAKEGEYEYFDFVGANNKNLCEFKSQFNPILDFTYSIKREDILGRLAEDLYIRFRKRKNI